MVMIATFYCIMWSKFTNVTDAKNYFMKYKLWSFFNYIVVLYDFIYHVVRENFILDSFIVVVCDVYMCWSCLSINLQLIVNFPVPINRQIS